MKSPWFSWLLIPAAAKEIKLWLRRWWTRRQLPGLTTIFAFKRYQEGFSALKPFKTSRLSRSQHKSWGLHHGKLVGDFTMDKIATQTQAVTDLNSIRRIFMDFDSDGSGLIEPPAAWPLKNHDWWGTWWRGTPRGKWWGNDGNFLNPNFKGHDHESG